MIRFEANEASGLTEIIRDWVLPLGPRLSVIARPVIARLPVNYAALRSTGVMLNTR